MGQSIPLGNCNRCNPDLSRKSSALHSHCTALLLSKKRFKFPSSPFLPLFLSSSPLVPSLARFTSIFVGVNFLRQTTTTTEAVEDGGGSSPRRRRGIARTTTDKSHPTQRRSEVLFFTVVAGNFNLDSILWAVCREV